MKDSLITFYFSGTSKTFTSLPKPGARRLRLHFIFLLIPQGQTIDNMLNRGLGNFLYAFKIKNNANLNDYKMYTVFYVEKYEKSKGMGKKAG